MRGLKVVLIIFALIVFSASASALSLPSQLSSLIALQRVLRHRIQLTCFLQG